MTVVAAHRHARGVRTAWATLAAGTLALGLDDLLGGHEQLGAWLFDRGVGTPRGFHHLDDLLMAVIALSGAVTVAFVIRALRNQRTAARLLLAGVAVLGLGASFDVILPPSASWSFYTEELTEAVGAAVVAASAWRGANLAPPARTMRAWAKLRHWLLRLHGRQPASQWRG